MLIDLDMPVTGQPTVAWPKGAFPVRPVFVAVIPPGGSEEDARLFAVCTLRKARIDAAPFHEGPRPDILPTEGYVLETIDPEAVPRLFERGSHPGDFVILGGGKDRFGRPETAVFTAFYLDQGFTYDYKLSTPAELRVGLAKACAAVGDPMWDRAAETFDPLGLMRNGMLKGGNPVTEAEFHRYMLEKSAGTVSDLPAIRDFRSLTMADLCGEILGDAKATVSANPDMRKDHVGHRLLREALPSFANALRDGNASEAMHMLSAVQGLYGDPSLRDGSCPAMNRLANGAGAAANCFRNLFDPNGLLSIAEERMSRPSVHDDIVSAVAALPDWARRAFRDPDEVLRRRPRLLDDVSARLNDRHRPFLALNAVRLTASPGLRQQVSELGDNRLEHLLEGTETLIKAFDTVPNSFEATGQARDALALGWHVLASEAARRHPDRMPSLTERDPGIPEAAARLPWIGSVSLGEGSSPPLPASRR